MTKILTLVRRHWVILSVLVVLAAFLFYRQTILTKNKSKESYKVRREILKDTLSFSGEIGAGEKADLKFQTGGLLSWVGVKEGDRVARYQTVATLDQRQLRKQFQEDLNTYVKSRIDFDQAMDNAKDTTQQTLLRSLQKAQMDLNNAVLDVEIQDLVVKLSNLYTPIDGVVTSLNEPVAGVNVGLNQIIMQIVNPYTVYFSALPDQTDVVKLQEGMEGQIVLDAYPDEEIKGTIQNIAFTPKEDETGTVYQVKMSLGDTNANNRYRLGMTGDVDFVLREIPNVLVIPTSFIKTENGKKYVLKNQKGSQVKAFIQTGETVESQTEVVSGLKEGDIIYD